MNVAMLLLEGKLSKKIDCRLVAIVYIYIYFDFFY